MPLTRIAAAGADAVQIQFSPMQMKAIRQAGRNGQRGVDTEYAAAVLATEMRMAIMRGTPCGNRKAQHATGIHRLAHDTGSKERVEDAIQRHPVDVRSGRFQAGLDLGMAQRRVGKPGRLSGREQQLKHLATTGRHPQTCRPQTTGSRIDRVTLGK